MNFTKEELDWTPVPAGKVVFLGSNPSCSSPYNDPFSHCKSANKMLNEWIPALGLTRDQVYFMNVANYKTPKNRPLKKSEIRDEMVRLGTLLQDAIVVTLGKTAAIAMEMVVTDYAFACQELWDHAPHVVELPHPSGMNRKLNDREWVRLLLATTRVTLDRLRSTPGMMNRDPSPGEPT